MRTAVSSRNLRPASGGRAFRFLALAWIAVAGPLRADPPPPGPWEMVFRDEFDGADADLDSAWEFQNGPSGHILASRWRENAVLSNGVLRLVARKEKRGGQEWTAASLWTRRTFQYGWFECRYRYLPAPGGNNSFWIMTRGGPKEAQRFEIDINEGHYPDEINMNLHNHSGKHWARGGRWLAGGAEADPLPDPGFAVVLNPPLRTAGLRVVSDDTDLFRVMELRAFAAGRADYPAALSEPKSWPADVTNLAAGAHAEASSTLNAQYGAGKAVDNRLGTASRWVSGTDSGPHVLTLSLDAPREIGCIQLVTGWTQGKTWHDTARRFRIEFLDGTTWRPVPGGRRETPEHRPLANLSCEFHRYALLWTETDLVYYFDGHEIRRTPNDICHRPAPVWLSLAVINWAGPVTDALDGKSMDVDWVRVWQRPAGNGPAPEPPPNP